MMKKIIYLLICSATSFNLYSQEFKKQDILKFVQILSHDSLNGRKTGTEGNSKARNLIADYYKKFNLKTFNDSYISSFSSTEGKVGKNIIGYIKGTVNPQDFIVVSAHYDHLGEAEGKVYHGADDNASGIGGLLAGIEYFSGHRPETSILFAAFDAEEQGLIGSKAFVKNPPVSLKNIILNINMDMISRNEKNELYACGTRYSPYLKKYIEDCCSDFPAVKLMFGHDVEDKVNPSNDWTSASDHGPFHDKKIPFIYFGVEDHEDYHKPTDTFDRIDQPFYLSNIKLIIKAIETFDNHYKQIKPENKH